MREVDPRPVDVDLVRPRELGLARDDLDLATLGEALEPTRQLADDLLLPLAQAIEVDFGLAEADPERGRLLGFRDHAGGVQQRLRGDAADVQADAAEHVEALDEHDLEAEVGGAEGGRVAAGSGADDDDAAGLGLALSRRTSRIRPHGTA